jgi:hypothetical protein
MDPMLLLLAIIGGLASIVGIPLTWFLARRSRQGHTLNMRLISTCYLILKGSRPAAK